MIESTFLAGRAWERTELTDALKSDRPELIAVGGRRRAEARSELIVCVCAA